MNENDIYEDDVAQGKTEVKFKFALRNQKIISIMDIPFEEKGLACNCTCPQCKAPLQAKIGTGKRQRHFSHVGEACQIELVQQTALHMMAKEIIEEEKCVCFPAVTVFRGDILDLDEQIDEIYEECFGSLGYSYAGQSYDNYVDVLRELPRFYTYKNETVVRCDSVLLEKRISDIVPDVMITKNGRKCLIEITVTHGVDETKWEKLQAINLPVLEIDLSDLYQSEFTRKDVKDIIKKKNQKKRWIYHPSKQQALESATKFYSNEIRKLAKSRCEYIIGEERAKRKKTENRINAQNKLNRLLVPENYRAALLGLRNDALAYTALRGRSFYRAQMRIPFYMDIPIKGEMIFKCDRRIWQSAIFDKFVYNRIAHDGEPITLSVKRIKKWVLDYQKEFKVDWELMPLIELGWTKSSSKMSLLEYVLMQYVIRLSELWFIELLENKEVINKSDVNANFRVHFVHNIEPPNRVDAHQMKLDLQSVDTFAIDVWAQIEKLPLIEQR